MRRKNRVEALLSANGDFDAFIVKSPADIAYLVGITFPFPDQSMFPAALVVRRDNPDYTLIVPAEWESILKSFSWKEKSKVYSINDGTPITAFLNALREVIEKTDLCGKKAAVDYSSWTVSEIAFLKENCPNMVITDLDPIIDRIREIKTEDEIECIQAAAQIADRGLIGALNHVEGTIGTGNCTLSEFLERVRAHAIEFGANWIGYMNICQGRKGRSWYTPIYDLSFAKEGKTIRIDYSLTYKSYWTKCSRIFFAGKPDQKAKDAYANNMKLKNFAVSILKPGIRISDFCEAIRLKAEEEEIELLYDEGFGHGVGTSEYELPMLCADNDEVLKAGMVIALDVKTIGSKDEIIHSVDIYHLTPEGNTRLSDFRNWDTMYLINGVHTEH